MVLERGILTLLAFSLLVASSDGRIRTHRETTHQPTEGGVPAGSASGVCSQPKDSGWTANGRHHDWYHGWYRPRPSQAFRRLYYNSNTHQCEPFTYYGRGGNSNNFWSVAECEQACIIRRAPQCFFPEVPGRCRAYFERFSFNTATGECQMFVYGGCGGNVNRFRTLDQCQRTCASASTPTPASPGANSTPGAI